MTIAEDTIRGAVYGLLIGDALGVPYEFHSPSSLPKLADIEFTPPPSFARSHRAITPGTWSDDGAQALCLLASLLHCRSFDAQDFAQRLSDWYYKGYMALDQHVFDVGMQTMCSIEAIRKGEDPLYVGLKDMDAKGNGSLMRVLPLALWHRGSDEELVQLAQDQSCVTHGAYACQVCCALYCLWARRILQQHPEPYSDAVLCLRRLYEKDNQYRDCLEEEVQADAVYPVSGTGYVVDSLHSTRWALRQASYEQVVKSAVSLGKDTDTTACIAGGIAGLVYGASSIPQRWMDALRGKEIVEPLVQALLQYLKKASV